MPDCDERFTYRYFVIGDVNPVQLTFGNNTPSVGMDAHSADRDRPGELKRAMHLISTVLFKDEDVEEITREQFDEHCKRVWAKSRR